MKHKTSSKPHVGPGKRVVSVYADEAFWQAVGARAKSLGMSVSRYLAKLAEDDLEKPGPMVLQPKDRKRIIEEMNHRGRVLLERLESHEAAPESTPTSKPAHTESKERGQ